MGRGNSLIREPRRLRVTPGGLKRVGLIVVGAAGPLVCTGTGTHGCVARRLTSLIGHLGGLIASRRISVHGSNLLDSLCPATRAQLLGSSRGVGGRGGHGTNCTSETLTPSATFCTEM